MPLFLPGSTKSQTVQRPMLLFRPTVNPSVVAGAVTVSLTDAVTAAGTRTPPSTLAVALPGTVTAGGAVQKTGAATVTLTNARTTAGRLGARTAATVQLT